MDTPGPVYQPILFTKLVKGGSSQTPHQFLLSFAPHDMHRAGTAAAANGILDCTFIQSHWAVDCLHNIQQ